MNRERWMLLVSIVLFAVAGVYHWGPRWVSRSSRREPPPQALQAPAPLPQVSPAQAPATASPPARRRASRDEGQWGRNPFLALEAATKRSAPMHGVTAVSVVIVGPDRSVATLDGLAVTVGEKFGDETVVQIRPDMVVLERDGRRRLLRVSEPRIPIRVTKGKK